MEPITIGLSIVVLVTTAVAAVVRHYRTVQRKNEEIKSLQNALGQYVETYSFEECDKDLINKCRIYIDSKFNNRYDDVFSKYETMDEKKKFANQIILDIAQRLNINLTDIKIEDLGNYTRGYAEAENGKTTIVINEALLVADPKQFVKTVCHELRHCIQHKSITDNCWGFSDQRVAEWIYSWRNYINCSSEVDYLAYRHQIIEVDANSFANAIIPD